MAFSCMREFDSFTKTVSFNLDRGQSEYRSSLGGCLNILIGSFMVVFSTMSSIQLFRKNGTLFNSYYVREFFDQGEEFTSDNGLFLAFAIIDYPYHEG